MKYKVLLFDVDNTILDFDANEKESFQCMMRDLGEIYTEALYQEYHELNKEVWKRIERREITVNEGVESRFALLMERHGRLVDGRLWEMTFRNYLNKGIQLMPGVHEVLGILKKWYPLYVITNGMTQTQEFRMRESGLELYFEELFISEKIGLSKPSKEYFEHIASCIPGFRKEEALIIGDSLTSDIQGGNNAGIDTCWITREAKAQPVGAVPTYIIHSLSELPELLEVPEK